MNYNEIIKCFIYFFITFFILCKLWKSFKEDNDHTFWIWSLSWVVITLIMVY